jgi:hypothetical protein
LNEELAKSHWRNHRWHRAGVVRGCRARPGQRARGQRDVGRLPDPSAALKGTLPTTRPGSIREGRFG